jgi:hypothetical protein
MLPILPAILLLILNGPAGVERLGHDAALTQLRQGSSMHASVEDAHFIASILALDSDEQASQALLGLILSGYVIDFQDSAPLVGGAPPLEQPDPPIPGRSWTPAHPPLLSQGRTRDGPSAGN